MSTLAGYGLTTEESGDALTLTDALDMFTVNTAVSGGNKYCGWINVRGGGRHRGCGHTASRTL